MIIPCLQQRCMHISTRFANRIVSRNIRNSSDLIKKKSARTYKIRQDNKKSFLRGWKFYEKKKKKVFLCIIQTPSFANFFEKIPRLLVGREIIGEKDRDDRFVRPDNDKLPTTRRYNINEKTQFSRFSEIKPNQRGESTGLHWEKDLLRDFIKPS